MNTRIVVPLLFIAMLLTGGARWWGRGDEAAAGPAIASTLPGGAATLPSDGWSKSAASFHPPARFVGEFGEYRSPLKFADGREVKTAADWAARRKEILADWHGRMGRWPAVIEQGTLRELSSERRENFTQKRVRLAVTDRHTWEGYLLVPDGEGRRPAVIVVFYEPETAVGLGDPKKVRRDFGLQLVRRGFVVLSIGTGASLYYPDQDHAAMQPLSALAYAAANAYHALANRAEVDPDRIGITGHSYGGKWAMFASCLYDKFAAAAWSDPGVVFDEKRSNVNYWEPWYLGLETKALGFDPPAARKPGPPTDANPRTGAYQRMIADGRDLHELHALMAPRPFLVSGGSEDPPQRWIALNHALAVNRLLGHADRVAMTNRPTHDPTADSNEALCLFFEHFLKEDQASKPRR